MIDNTNPEPRGRGEPLGRYLILSHYHQPFSNKQAWSDSDDRDVALRFGREYLEPAGSEWFVIDRETGETIQHGGVD